jgi:CMP-N-acetylneuraminic acid synthetase
MHNNIIGIIPARGGSKGIPRKNIVEVAGKPLIAWSIEAAKKSKLLDDFYVSTEDMEIAQIARSLGAKVLLRPEELARDETTTTEVLADILNKIKADIIVIIQPTSPVRHDGLIDECVIVFNKKKADCLATGFYCNYAEWGTYNPIRQKRKGFFYDDGNLYIVKSETIRKGNLIGDKIERVILSKPENIDIDDYYDLWLAEQLLLKFGNRKYEKSTFYKTG